MATAALQVGGILASILGSAHADAVAAEANNLNIAVPNYRKNLLAIVGAFNAGQIDSATAQQAVDEAINQFYSSVSGIISAGRGPTNCSNLNSNCNGPCIVGCDWVVPWGRKTQSAIQQGSATVSFDAIPSHAGFNGLSAWSLTVARSTVGLVTDHTGVTIPALVSSGSVLPPSPASSIPISNPTSILASLSGSAGGVATITPTPVTSSIFPQNQGVSVLPSNPNKLIILLGIVLAFFAVLALLFGKQK